VFRSLLPVLYPRCTLALAGLVVSNTCFVMAALALFWLGCLTLRDGDLALRAAYLFCFNPASVFFSAVYTESLFAFLSWAGALSLCVDCPWRGALALAAAAATRSNGACGLPNRRRQTREGVRVQVYPRRLIRACVCASPSMQASLVASCSCGTPPAASPASRDGRLTGRWTG
jgi:GPI mannosyltransferase 2